MSIKNLTCECCLGALKQIGDKTYKCESCDKEYIDHAATEEEIIWLANTNQTLRKGNFDDAYEEFSNIVSKYPSCYEAYYGMCLCTHGVLFVDDILENNITFKIPYYNAEIHMEKISGENFKKARSRGAFEDIDFLKTNFTAYRPCLYMYGKRTRSKIIRMHKAYTKKLDEYTNNGKIYC